MKKTIQNTIIKYRSTGVVLGNLWGGGKGGYGARPLEAPTKKALIAEAKKSLRDGTLDSGMGFDGLIGAQLNIVKETTLEIDDKQFINEESEMVVIGDMTDEDADFLDIVMFNY